MARTTQVQLFPLTLPTLEVDIESVLTEISLKFKSNRNWI